MARAVTILAFSTISLGCFVAGAMIDAPGRFEAVYGGPCRFCSGVPGKDTGELQYGSRSRDHSKGIDTTLAPRPAIFTTFDLLWAAESSCGVQMAGDGGFAKGHFQQHKAHWEYGCKQLGVNWPFSDANNLARAAAITAANWAGHAKHSLRQGDIEMLVRSHRLPCDPYRPSNNEYVKFVMKGDITCSE